MDEADLLLDRPPGGWSDVVTKDWLHLELGALEARMDARFAALEARLGALEARTNGRFAALEARLGALEAGTNARFGTVEARLGTIEQVLAKMDSRLDQLAREVRSQTWRLVSVFVVVMGIAIGANKL